MTVETINGTRLNIRIDRVAPDAPWIVFGNSLLTDLSIWDAQVEALAGRWNRLRYDQRGHGGSDPSGAVDFDLLSDDLLGVMDHTDARRVVYVGLSMGVPTGLAAYDKAPGRFAALILINGQAKSTPGAAQSWSERIEAARQGGMAECGRITAERWLTNPARAERLAAMIAATTFEGFKAGATALKSYDYAAILPKISVPCLLLAGAEDGQIPETMSIMAEAITDARFEAIANAGHVPCFEQPAEVNAKLADFFDGQGAT